MGTAIAIGALLLITAGCIWLAVGKAEKGAGQKVRVEVVQKGQEAEARAEKQLAGPRARGRGLVLRLRRKRPVPPA